MGSGGCTAAMTLLTYGSEENSMSVPKASLASKRFANSEKTRYWSSAERGDPVKSDQSKAVRLCRYLDLFI